MTRKLVVRESVTLIDVRESVTLNSIDQSQRHETPRRNYTTTLILRKYNSYSIAVRHFRVSIESMSSLGRISPTYTSLLQTPIPTM